MRAWFAVGLAVVLNAAPVAAQDRTQLYSSPVPPPREVLDRLNLKQLWLSAVPMDGKRDGFLSLAVSGNHLVAQTRSGLVALLDADTGRLIWQTRVGKEYAGTLALAYNSYGVYAVNNGILYGLDRDNGRVLFQYTLPTGLATAPVADEEQIYLVSTNRRCLAFRVPQPAQAVPLTPSAPPPGGPPASPPPGPGYETPPARSVALLPSWDNPIRFPVDLRPVVGGDMVLLASQEGQLMGLTRAPLTNFGAAEGLRFTTDGQITAPPGVFEDTAYVGSKDASLYALSLTSGRLVWRYSAGTPVLRRPAALAEDVYVVSDGQGMARVNRATGEPLWKIPRGRAFVEAQAEADRFLAANPKFVYAFDRSGRLLILDRARGLVLGTLDTRDFVYPVVNETTDRLFLAANNGVILCLHDREYVAPHRHRKVVVPPSQDPARMPFDPAIQATLKKKLDDPVNIEADSPPTPLQTILEGLSQKYDFKVFVSPKAYEEAGKPLPLDRPVVLHKAMNVPLKEVLKDLLEQADSRFFPTDRILVFPKGKPMGEKPPEKPPEKPAEKP